MAGKRFDQFQIDPREGRSTDHKFNPEDAQQRGGDHTHLRNADKARLETGKGDQPFLPHIPSPSAEANRALKAQQGQMQSDEPAGAADTSTGKENPAV